MTWNEWQYQVAVARLNDVCQRGRCSQYEEGLRRRWPLSYGQTAVERERFITSMIIASWSWR